MSKFFTIEGPDGSGKSSCIEHIREEFSNKGIPLLVTKEPGSPLDKGCVELRKFILNPDNDIDNEAEIFLYMADRCQHVNRIIKPNLSNGINVLCDRYIDSTYAYQGWGRRHGKQSKLDYINFLNSASTNNLIPDLTLILYVDPEVGMQRLSTKEFGKKDRLEKEAIDFHKRVCEGYLDLFNKNISRNIKMIDTSNKTEDEVKNEAIKLFLENV